MLRTMCGLSALAITLALVSGDAFAAKPKGASEPVFNGTITKISDDGKFITFRPVKSKKSKLQGVMEVKVTPETKVEFLGFDSKDEKKLKEGLGILVTVNDTTRDTAVSMKISKDAPKDEEKKKKKVKAAA